jgi:hypothetical protein
MRGCRQGERVSELGLSSQPTRDRLVGARTPWTSQSFVKTSAVLRSRPSRHAQAAVARRDGASYTRSV